MYRKREDSCKYRTNTQKHDVKVQMWRESVLCEPMIVAAGQPESLVVANWPAGLQIHSPRLMLCHPALSAIKLAPVLKGLAANAAEAEMFLHLHRHSD